MAALLKIEKVKENQARFAEKVISISILLGINPNWLMECMDIESGLNYKAKNKSSGAVGLIQFLPSTLKAMGTDEKALLSLSNVDQLNYVYAYLRPYKSKLKSFTDVYLAIFFPAAIGKSANQVIESKTLSADLISRLNPIFDLNKDKKITIKEIYTTITKKIPVSFMSQFKAPVGTAGVVLGLSALFFC